MSDETSSWSLESDGSWARHSVDASGAPLVDLQNRLMYQISHRPRAAVRL
jgi:polyphosphate kinase